MIGLEKTTVTNLVVEEGKVKEFARSIKSKDPVHYSSESSKKAGLERIPAPLTFTRVSYFPRHRPDNNEIWLPEIFNLKFDPRYMVHGEQSYEYNRPVYVGEVLHGSSKLTDVYQRENDQGNTLTFAIIETKYFNEENKNLITVKSTYIETQNPRSN